MSVVVPLQNIHLTAARKQDHCPPPPFHRIHRILFYFSIQTPLISSVLCKVPKPPTSLQTIISSVTALNTLGSYSSSLSGKLHPSPPDSTLLYPFISKSLYIWYLFLARLLLSFKS